MRQSALILIFCSAMTMEWAAQAQSTPQFQNITGADYDAIVKEFSGNSIFTTVSPASSLGKLWGVEFGLVAGVTRTPQISSLVKQADPSSQGVDSFPHASLLLAVTVPYGLTVEGTLFPKVSQQGVSYNQFGIGLKWTATDVVLSELPVTLALETYYAKTQLSFSQTVNNASTGNVPVNVSVGFDDSVWGSQLIVSKQLTVFEPYLGWGFAQANGNLSITGSTSATFFAPSFTSGQSATASPVAGHLFLGFNVQLGFFVAGAEYSKVYDTNSYTAKLSLRF